MLHCRYFQLKAQGAGYNVFLGAIIEYDPLTSRQDKDDLFSRDTSLKVDESEREDAEQFFVALARAERALFDQPFTLANFERYRDVAFQE